MKTRIEHKKINYDFWNLSEIKRLFEMGVLYYMHNEKFIQIKDKPTLSFAVVEGDDIYHRIETKITLHQELCEIFDGSFHFEESYSGGQLNICAGTNLIAQFKPGTIHKLSEILKRHEK